ncbi:MAG: hypothetical protein GF399_02040 [Candidatus Coatesbacteria bacterium]|nr:hypothetical protein [Candidatus Coatesbacteria bacterium]
MSVRRGRLRWWRHGVRVLLGLGGWLALSLYALPVHRGELLYESAHLWVLLPAVGLIAVTPLARLRYEFDIFDPSRGLVCGLLLYLGAVPVGWALAVGEGVTAAFESRRDNEGPWGMLSRASLAAGRAALWCAGTGWLWRLLLERERFYRFHPAVILGLVIAVGVSLAVDGLLWLLRERESVPEWNSRLTGDAWGGFAAVFAPALFNFSNHAALGWMVLIVGAGLRLGKPRRGRAGG